MELLLGLKEAMSTEAITKLAVSFRAAVEACPRERLPITFQSFPRGSCGDACLLLGAWLEDSGHTGFYYICGQRNSQSHAWLQRADLIVDITADQFGPNLPPVYVGPKSDFYMSFEQELKQPGVVSPSVV